MTEPQPGSLFEPGPKTEDPGVGWSYVNRPVDRPQETPIFEQLVAEATYDQPSEDAPPELKDKPDPLLGAP